MTPIPSVAFDRRGFYSRGALGIAVAMYFASVAACGVQEFPHDSVPAAASKAISLQIDGEAVPRDHVVAFIHFGHSNMLGRGNKPVELRPYFFDDIDPHAWRFHVAEGLQPALEPFTAGRIDPKHGLGGGPGTPLVKEAAALAPDIDFISLGYGNSGAYCSQFLPGSLYYDTVMAGPRALKGSVEFGGIVVMLGITERHGTDDQIKQFSQCMLEVVSAIREELESPDLPLLLSDYEREASGAASVDTPFAQAIIPEIQKVPDVVPNSAIVPTDGLSMQDDHHFDLDGHRVWVARLLQIMQDKGWFPWD